MSGRQNYLLLAVDMAKVGGPLSIVKVCTSVSRWSTIPCEGFDTNLNIPCPLLTILVYSFCRLSLPAQAQQVAASSKMHIKKRAKG